MKKSALILTVITLMIMTSGVNATTNNKVAIKGHVIDMVSKTPVRFAGIILEDSSNIYATITDENGEFILSDVSIGRHTIQIKPDAYKDNIYYIDLIGSKEIAVNFEIKPYVSKDNEQPLMENNVETNYSIINILPSVRICNMIIGFVLNEF